MATAAHDEVPPALPDKGKKLASLLAVSQSELYPYTLCAAIPPYLVFWISTSDA